MTASFMNSDFKIYNILFELKYLSYSHTVKHIWDMLQTIMRTWNFQEKVIAIMMDNDSNMIKAISYFSNIIRILYTTHTLQLVIEKDLTPILVFIV